MRLNKKRVKDLAKTIVVYGDNTQTVVNLAEDHIEARTLLEQLRDRLEYLSISGRPAPVIPTSQLIAETDTFLEEPKLSPRKDPNPSEG